VPGSATANGRLAGSDVHWDLPALKAGETRDFTFRVVAKGGQVIVNDDYAVTSAAGASAFGPPVITRLTGHRLFMPLIRR
jgi:hypothetical protein